MQHGPRCGHPRSLSAGRGRAMGAVGRRTMEVGALISIMTAIRSPSCPAPPRAEDCSSAGLPPPPGLSWLGGKGACSLTFSAAPLNISSARHGAGGVAQSTQGTQDKLSETRRCQAARKPDRQTQAEQAEQADGQAKTCRCGGQAETGRDRQHVVGQRRRRRTARPLGLILGA